MAITKNRTAEARAVERARIVLACLAGKEIQQVSRELRVSIATVSKWRQRFSLWGLRGLRDQARPGKPIRYGTAFRNQVLALLEEPPPPGHVALGRAGGGMASRRQRARRLARSA